MARSAGIFICIVIVLTVGHGLATARDWLLWPVAPWSIPLGNLATWIGLIALASLAAAAVRPSLRWPARLSLSAAAAWFPASVLLSGNVSNTFHAADASMWIWRILTAVTAALPLVLLVVAGLVALVGKRRSSLD